MTITITRHRIYHRRKPPTAPARVPAIPGTPSRPADPERLAALKEWWTNGLKEQGIPLTTKPAEPIKLTPPSGIFYTEEPTAEEEAQCVN